VIEEKLLIVDEYFQVAHGGLEDMELALAAARKHRCRIWLCCVGGMRELMAIHGENVETVLESCGVVQWLTARGKNVKILSEMCGDTERYTYGKSIGTELMGQNGQESKRGPSVNETRGQVSRKLLLPHEAEAINGSAEQILFFSDIAGPVRALKAGYRDVPGLSRYAAPNPYYEGTL
jgi:type IV secretory pathway TraG/TraD family ATPase VirD4